MFFTGASVVGVRKFGQDIVGDGLDDARFGPASPVVVVVAGRS